MNAGKRGHLLGLDSGHSDRGTASAARAGGGPDGHLGHGHSRHRHGANVQWEAVEANETSTPHGGHATPYSLGARRFFHEDSDTDVSLRCR